MALETDQPVDLSPQLVQHWSKENQTAAWKRVETLRQSSKFIRLPEASVECTLEKNGEKYQIERVTDPKSPELLETHKLLTDTFSAEEMDPLDVLQANLVGKSISGGDVDATDVYIVKDKTGEIVNAFLTSHFDLTNGDGRPTGETALFVYYAVTKDKMRGTGIARESYMSAIIDASLKAEKQGKK